MSETQARYKKNVDIRVKVLKITVNRGSQVFIRNYYRPTNDPNHKLAPIATRPYIVTGSDANTCVILRDNNVTDPISFYCVVLAPHNAFPMQVTQRDSKSRKLRILSRNSREFRELMEH